MILTDPIFSKRASPFQFIGPKRRTPSALNIEQLPQIDFIVISHNHYDHLDYNSIQQLEQLRKTRAFHLLKIGGSLAINPID